MVSQLESCYTDNNTYTGTGSGGTCLATATGLTYGTDKGQVAVTNVGDNTYTIDAHSQSDNHFLITKGTDGTTSRTCNGSGGGCPTSGGSW